MFQDLPRPFFVLAPMDDVTDTVFRRLIAACAPPDINFSEFVNVDGLMSPGRPHILTKLDRAESEPSLIAHIWGINPNNFRSVADQIASGELAAELGLGSNFAGVDLNMGCPAKDVVKTGACSALINNHELAQDIIQATQAGLAGRLPLSVKTRLGYNVIEPDWFDFLFAQDLAMLSVHLRTKKEMSLVNAHYDELIWIKQKRDMLSPDTLLVANGDIMSYSQGLQLASKYGIDGVMIGRGVFHDPYVFASESPWEKLDYLERTGLFIKHLNLYKQWSPEPDKAAGRLNKYAKIYINGFDGAKALREQIAEAKTIDDMLDRVRDFQARSIINV